jgi:hypothetical protein
MYPRGISLINTKLYKITSTGFATYKYNFTNFVDFCEFLWLLVNNCESQVKLRTTGYESYKYKITNISHNHKNSHKITIIYKNSQKNTKKLQNFCNFLWFFVNFCEFLWLCEMFVILYL